MSRGQSWLSLCCVLASLWDQVVSDVIVETVIGFKPVRIYEDAAARSDNISSVLRMLTVINLVCEPDIIHYISLFITSQSCPCHPPSVSPLTAVRLRFGDALPETGLVGFLVKAEPELGCDPIKPPPAVSHLPHGVHWIAMIRDNHNRW